MDLVSTNLLHQMSLPSKEAIERARDRVNGLKLKFEKSMKSRFHKWQLKVHAEFMAQIKKGASITILSPGLKKELTQLLISHYHSVAEAFVPGLTFPEVKQSIGENPAVEDEGDSLIDWMIPSVYFDIQKGINAQINIQLPIHERSIIDTTQRIGTQSVSIARLEQANPSVIMANKFSGRETTVSITETDWIAESSMNTALTVTTTAIAIADKKQLKKLQKISPNITLKELDIEEVFADTILLEATRRILAIPQKMWITMGDKKVRKTHSAVNGVQIPALQPFILAGGLLMYPADSSLGVAFIEVVNCRCYAMYF